MKTKQVAVNKKILRDLIKAYSLEMNCANCPFSPFENGNALCMGMGWNDDSECRDTLVELLTGKDEL